MKKQTDDQPEDRLQGDLLMQFRIARGMSRKQLSMKSGVGTRQILRLETERPDVTFATMIKIARALGCSLDYLGGLITDPNLRVTEADLTPRERSLLELLRGAENSPDRLLDALGALATDKRLRRPKQ